MATQFLPPEGFEEDHDLRSAFVRRLILDQGDAGGYRETSHYRPECIIPKVLIRYWHDASNLPHDVKLCLDSWEPLGAQHFDILTFNDSTAGQFISARFDKSKVAAFARCHHPAMRCDYFRLCYIYAEGGFYVDADDVLGLGSWETLYSDDRLKLQPLCYDLPTGTMVPSEDLWKESLDAVGRIFYVNNNPLIAPAGHPVVQRALARATASLLQSPPPYDIQSTTGPGNLTAALVAHARALLVEGAPLDFELLRCWDDIGKTKWELSYRSDQRNWRNMPNG